MKTTTPEDEKAKERAAFLYKNDAPKNWVIATMEEVEACYQETAAKDAQIVALREALEWAVAGEHQNFCVCARCEKAKAALSTPPPVVPLADVLLLVEAMRQAYVHNQNMHCFSTKGRLNAQLEEQTHLLRKTLADWKAKHPLPQAA